MTHTVYKVFRYVLIMCATLFSCSPICAYPFVIADMPYSLTSWDEVDADAILIDDANADNNTWGCIESPQGYMIMRYKYSTVNVADDYLYLPAMRLRQGENYEAVVYMRAGSSNYAEKFSIGVVSDTALHKTNPILCDVTTNSKSSTPYRLGFTVDTDSIYRLYIHCTSPANSHLLYVDSVKITSTENGALPCAVTDMTLTTCERNPDMVLLECTAPLSCVDNTPLHTPVEIAIYRNKEHIHSLYGVMPGEVVSFRDTVEVLGDYSYSVVCITESGKSMEVSGLVTCGAAQLPFTHNFVDGIGFGTIVDNNADGVTWHYYEDRFMGCMRYISSAVENADDWLISPPIYFPKTTTYMLSYSCCVGLSFYPESLRVMMGVVPQPNAMSIVIDEQFDIDFINDTTISVTFDVAKPGYYYIAMQACSVADRYAIMLRNISIDYDSQTSVVTPDDDRNIVGVERKNIVVHTDTPQELTVYNMMGGVVVSRKDVCYASIPLQSGCYIVQLGECVRKIIIP